ncbi:cilia- and flagella- associated protein 210 [Pristis pectinata]|uniref:cilia- and flagella- associated protein 210 n=1 Tax=Pristis pectinata TaxID=685728 RepID=UPI00223DF701|nr:cilia- and flagella- associated protein 210 [Pristis pectinata]
MATATNFVPPNGRSMSDIRNNSGRISLVRNTKVCAPKCSEERDPGDVNAQIHDKPKDPHGLQFPNLVDLRQVTVLPKAEWQRIQDDLNGINKEAEFLRAQKEEREALHLQSKEVTKHWTNTIAGHRQKRLDAGKQRKEKEEEERRQIDLEEAKYKEQKRKENLERAKTLLFYQTDRVKGFNAALMLTEALKEREAQIELNQKRANFLKSQEKQFLEEMQRDTYSSEDVEYQKMLKQKEERKALSDFHQQQIKEHEQLRKQEKQQDIMEGKEIKKLMQLYKWELSKIEELKKQEKYNNKISHMAHVENNNIIKALEKQKEELHDEDIRLYVLAKQKMMKLRKERQAEMDKEKEDQRNLIVKIISEQMREEARDETERIKKAAEEKEAKREMEIKKKEEKLLADMKAIEEHRIMMMKEREEKEKEEKLQAIEILHAKMEADYVHHEKERKKKLKKLEEGGNLQSFLLEQMAEKKAKALRERAAELEHEQKTMALLEVEKKEFEKYVQEVIDTASKKGRNVYPLIKAAHKGIGGGHGPVLKEKGGIRPSYQVKDTSGVQLPNYKSTTAEAIKNLYDKCDIEKSKKSLGFIW